MSLFTNGQTAVFPMAFIKGCIATYTKEHGKAPKILVVATEDYLDFALNCTLPKAEALGVEVITHGEYLKSGELDLAMGIKPEKK